MNRRLLLTAVASVVGVALVVLLGQLDLMPESTAGRLLVVAAATFVIVLVAALLGRRSRTSRVDGP